MSEGELMNTRSAIDSRDIFEKGIGGFSSKSINELFDANEDGVTSGVERDLMSSADALNTLSSISPVVAHAFTQENFRLQTGAYLTNSQKVMRNKLLLSINKAILMEKLKEIPEKEIKEELNIDNGSLDTNDLMKDIAHRQYLNQNELDNGV
jgi:hypothetical protein